MVEEAEAVDCDYCYWEFCNYFCGSCEDYQACEDCCILCGSGICSDLCCPR